MALARDYGTKLYTGVFYRNPEPAPTYDGLVRQLQQDQMPKAVPRERILDVFVQR
jgi:2-oxoglutarate ferredoxin oxidoreductase subunit beta